jgi:hypothetical protein
MAGHVGMNGVLLKVRKVKYKGKHGKAQVEAEKVFLLFRCF